MSSQIKSSPTKTLHELLTTINYCSIPAFQRSYNWTTKQLSSLWEGIVENEDHYYIGNLVVIDRIDNNAESFFEIIDGQQRITTLCIFLIAIRNFVQKDKEKRKIFSNLKHDDIVSDINLILYKVGSFGENKVTYKLRFFKENLNRIYKNLVGGESSEEIDDVQLDDNQKRFKRNLLTATSFLREYFKEKTNKTRALQTLIEKLKKLEFILIVCESHSNAYKLFEGLNSTGLELSVVDLVKNSVFLSVNSFNPKALSRVENTWQEIENIFETYDIKRLPKFLRHQWIASEGYVNTLELYDRIQEKKLNKLENVFTYIESLKTDAKSYVGLKTANEQLLDKKIKIKHNRIFERIRKFSWLDVDQVYAVLLAYYKKHVEDPKNYTSKLFCQDLDRLWNFSFIVRFIDLSPSLYEKKFADRCKEISNYEGKSYNSESQKFNKILSDMIRGREEEFSRNFSADFQYVPNADNSLIRHVLQQYLWYGETGGIKSVKKEEPSIEHILPQSPAKWGRDESEIESYVHKIGNLTLLGDAENGSITSEIFESKYEKLYKKDVYPKNKKLKAWIKKFELDPENAIQERGQQVGSITYKLFQ